MKTPKKDGLKWKKDGTAKCGQHMAKVDWPEWSDRPRWEIFSTNPFCSEKASFQSTHASCEHAAGLYLKAKANRLKKQAKQMLKDLGGDRG